jgi:uncharacterized coiled-coil protein SlyX
MGTTEFQPISHAAPAQEPDSPLYDTFAGANQSVQPNPRAARRPADTDIPPEVARTLVKNMFVDQLEAADDDTVYDILTKGEIANFFSSQGKSLGDIDQSLARIFEGVGIPQDAAIKLTNLFNVSLAARETSFQNSLLEEVSKYLEDTRASMNEMVDEYLSYCVREWVNDNRVAIEDGADRVVLSNVITGIMEGIRSSGVDVTGFEEGRINSLMETVKEQREEISYLNEKVLALTESRIASIKSEIIRKEGEKLTAVRADRLNRLCESLQFVDEDSFRASVKMIAENFVSRDETDGGAFAAGSGSVNSGRAAGNITKLLGESRGNSYDEDAPSAAVSFLRRMNGK